MLELRVFILDLIAIVDDADGRRWILFPDARSGGVRDDGTQAGIPIDRHFPMVLFDTDDVNGGDWKLLKNQLGLEGDRHGFAWSLNREEVLLPEPANESTHGVFQEVGVAGGETIPDQGSAGDVSWVPLLNAAVDPACIKAGVPVTTNKIVARSSLIGGRFQTASFARVASDELFAGEVRPFKFGFAHPPNGQGSRALADRLLAIYEIDGDHALIQARSFDLDTDGKEKIRAFELRPRSGMHVINILLANVSPLNPAQVPETAGLHFHLYYDLVATPPPSSGRPIPFLAPNTTGTSPGLVTFAMPAVFENAFRNPIGPYENKICTTPKMLASGGS